MACHQVKGQQRNGDKFMQKWEEKEMERQEHTQKDEKKANDVGERELIS
mgnify:CR=1 FL=1